jgi:AhpD family alkylhydroperoxidase
MTERLDYPIVSPVGTKAFGSAYAYVKQCGLALSLIDLVFLRTSQINGCAYCIDSHSRDLLKNGMAVEKIFLVPAWREAGDLFDARERAALAWAETVTLVAETDVPDADYAAAAEVFTEKELVDLTMTIAIMNAYNRLAISFRKVPATVAEAAARRHDT